MDEAHYIKSPSSKRRRRCASSTPQAWVLLTGSPLLNRPDELWALLNFIDPQRFKNRYQFRNRFCVMGGFKNKEIIGVKNKGELRGIIDEYMLRRLKKDCLDLPDKQVIRLKVEMHPDQEKWYRKMETELMLEIPNDPDPIGSAERPDQDVAPEATVRHPGSVRIPRRVLQAGQGGRDVPGVHRG